MTRDIDRVEEQNRTEVLVRDQLLKRKPIDVWDEETFDPWDEPTEPLGVTILPTSEC